MLKNLKGLSLKFIYKFGFINSNISHNKEKRRNTERTQGLYDKEITTQKATKNSQ